MQLADQTDTDYWKSKRLGWSVFEGNVRSDLKCRESVGADSFWVHLYLSQCLWVRMLCVGPRAVCGFVQLSQFIYRPVCTDCLGGIFAFISMYLKPH